MKLSTVLITFLTALLVLVTVCAAADKRPISHDDYDAWRQINSQAISWDGEWVLYLEVPGEGDGELVVQQVAGTKQYRHPVGYKPPRMPDASGEMPPPVTGASFTADSRHVVFLIRPTFEEQKAAKKAKGKDKDKKAPKNAVGILRLSDGDVATVPRVKSFKLPKEAGGWVAYLKEEKEEEEEKKPEEKTEEEKTDEGEQEGKKKEKKFGTELVLRKLQDGSEVSFADTLTYRFTKDGGWLLYTVSSKETPETDGMYARRPGDSESRALLKGKGNYKQEALDWEQTRLAFVSDRDSYSEDQPVFKLYGWDLTSDEAELWASHETIDGFPEGMAVSDKEGVSFTRDGKLVMFGVKEIPAKKKSEEDDEEEAKFDLWHWDDPYPQPQQKKLAKRYRDETFECVLEPDTGRFVRLADEELPDVRFAKRGETAFGTANLPYRKLIAYVGSFEDAYWVDPITGQRVKAAEKVPGAQASPTGRYLYWFVDGNWHVFDSQTRAAKNLTEGLDISFAREDWDTPQPARPYGTAGWTTDDAALLVYDKFDIWEFQPDGSGKRRITEGVGRETQLEFRYVKLDPEDDFVPAAEPLLLTALNTETMATGYYRDQVEGDQAPVKLVSGDRAYGRPVKAKEADQLLFSRNRFDEYPDLWTAPLDFSSEPRKLTSLGAQMDELLWGRSELRDFTSSDGRPLKGILIKPEGFDESKTYPLMVYIYETLHTSFHRYRHPGPGTSINPSYYVSNGYVLWMPDIEYDTGYPGQDALKCVLPGVQMLAREGYIDPKRIGIQGHSWGGYQISYMITQTNVFAAAEAGAPVSNMTSAYGGIRWGSGMVRQFQYERTQSRLGDALWEVPMRYINNSPLFFADRVETPLLFVHNDKDGAVPWYQGIEWIMALRRLGKEAYMFNYLGEDHGLRKRVNQTDWTIRMQQFFDHHLKGAPKPGWMEKGIQAWEKPEEKKQ
jgi:dipeptidyl aminopeptidase/acylaminoacyl peptidase